MTDERKTIERYGYHNTKSSAGAGQVYEIYVDQVAQLRKWINEWGNPSYNLITHNGNWYYTVDDFGGTNGLERIPLIKCDNKRDLFKGCLTHKETA
jgi:hypothetical protein